MNWLRRFMYGRNGVDQLSLAALILGMLISITAQLVRLPLLSLLSWLCMVVVFYRMFSRNLYKRREENMKFMGVLNRIKGWFQLRYRMVLDSRTYKYLKCPGCRQRIRAPRGKGRIRVTCQKCRESFECRT